MNDTRYLLIDEAADIARTSAATVRYWISTGRLRSHRPGRRILIDERDLKRFIENAAREPNHECAKGRRQ